MILKKILAFLSSLVIIIFNDTIKIIWDNLTTIILSIIIISNFLNFKKALVIVLIAHFILNSIIHFKHNVETIWSTYYSNLFGIVLMPKYINFKKEKETIRVSLKIDISSSLYYVVRFLKFKWSNVKFNKKIRQSDIPEGYIVFDEEGNLVSNRSKLIKILELYNFWHHYYINPLFREIKTNLFSLKNSIYTNKLLIEGIKIRQFNNYNKILKKTDEHFVKILKELDNLVLGQSPFQVSKISAQISLINHLYEIWERPSSRLYEKIQGLFEELKTNASKENEILNKRQNYWHKLTEYRANNIINKLKPEKIIKKTIFLSLIELIITKQIPILGPILGTIYELSKIPLRFLLLLYNDKVIYHKFGIDMIKREIELNKNLKKISNVINTVKNQPTVSLIRNEIRPD